MSQVENGSIALKENKMGTEPVFKLLMSMSLPAMFSMLIQSLYNVVDSIFVSQLGERALSSVSLAFPIQNVIVAVAVGTGVGMNSLIARSLGAKDQDRANEAATHGLVLAVMCSVVFAILGFFVTRPFFGIFTTDAEVIDMGVQYLSTVMIVSMGSFVQIIIERMLQSTGDMKHPMIIQLIGAITNIILDPIFIFGFAGIPAMGVLGAAVATVIGQVVGALYGLYVLFKKSHGVHVNFKGFKLKWNIVSKIYATGFPTIVMQSIGAVITIILNNILTAFSLAAVSVLGVYFKMQSFVFMPLFGLTHGLMPILGYNYGAKNKQRIVDVLKSAYAVGVAITLAGTLLFAFFNRPLLSMFNASPEMFEVGIPALRIISLCFVPASISILSSTLFQAMGFGFRSLIVSTTRQVIVLLPWAIVMSKVWGPTGVWTAYVVAEGVSLILSLILVRNTYATKIQYLDKKM